MNSDLIIEITGDCPFTDPKIIDLAIKTYLEGNFDVSNELAHTKFHHGDKETADNNNQKRRDVHKEHQTAVTLSQSKADDAYPAHKADDGC